MSGWGESTTPKPEQEVDAPTPARMHEMAKWMEEWSLVVLQLLADKVTEDMTEAEKETAEADAATGAIMGNELHGLAELLERGKARWEAL